MIEVLNFIAMILSANSSTFGGCALFRLEHKRDERPHLGNTRKGYPLQAYFVRGGGGRCLALRLIATGTKLLILRFSQTICQIEFASEVIKTFVRTIYDVDKNRSIGIKKNKLTLRIIITNPGVGRYL